MAVGTTRGKRRLGRFVKPIRLRSALKPEDVAELARCSRQTVTRLESGENLPRFHLFTTLLAVIGATPDEQAAALQLWDIADVDTANIEFVEDLPAKYRRFRLDESEAVLERTLDTVIIPGLLQAPDYVAALSRGRRRLSSEGWTSRAAAERRERQELLTRENRPLELHALIHEGALFHGESSVMISQLDHLLSMANLPNIKVQVVPANSPPHGAMSGPLFILSFPEHDEPDAMYVESVIGIESVGKSHDVVALSTVWDDIATAAPSPERSVEIIQAALSRVKGR
jgi:transcriptional regulator with XRE-family HTH domain